MDFQYISIKGIITDFIDDTGYEGQIKENTFYKWAESALRRCIPIDTMVHSISLIDIRDYEGLLPDGFKSITQVGCIPERNLTIKKEKVVQWTQREMGCELEINLKCDTCVDECTCSGPIITIDADELYRQSHPEQMMGHMKTFYDYGTFGQPQEHHYKYLNFFELMKPAQGTLRNSYYHLGDCAPFNFDLDYEYELNDKKIQVNFKEGQVALGYVGLRYDKEGYLMVPDHEYFLEAISWTLKSKMAYRKLNMEGSNIAMKLFEIAESKRLQYLNLARVAGRLPSEHSWNAIMEKYHTRRWGVFGEDLHNGQERIRIPRI